MALQCAKDKQRQPWKIAGAMQPVIEMMEQRMLLSASAVLGADGTLTVTGTSGADSIEINIEAGQSGGSLSGNVNVILSGGTTKFNAANVKRIHVNGLGGNDTILEDGNLDTTYIPSTLSGGDGNDTITDRLAFENGGARYSADVIDGDGGDDSLQVHGLALGTFTLNGGAGNDTFLDDSENGGGGGFAVENGDAGNDTFQWYEDSTITIGGGDGIDTLDTTPAAGGGALSINLAGVGGWSDGHVDASAADVENALIPGGGWSSLLVSGNALNNHITVNGGGADSISIDGGAGNDTIEASNASATTVNGGMGNDLLSVDTGSGSAATLNGDDGNDTLKGGHEADFFSGGGGFDTVDYSARTANLTIGIGVFADDGEAGEHDNVYKDIEAVIGGSGNDFIKGSDANNYIAGGGGNDTLLGLGGNDSIYGDAGNDLIDGGKGADFMSGGSGIDTVDYSSRTANLTIGIGVYADDGEAGEHDNVYKDIERVYGGSGNDLIKGTAADNALFGNGGNDTLISNGGTDALFGGTGNDTLLAKDGGKTFIDGGAGNDAASVDSVDTVMNVEHVMH